MNGIKAEIFFCTEPLRGGTESFLERFIDYAEAIGGISSKNQISDFISISARRQVTVLASPVTSSLLAHAPGCLSELNVF